MRPSGEHKRDYATNCAMKGSYPNAGLCNRIGHYVIIGRNVNMDVMTPNQYKKALKTLGITVASKRVEDALGITVRQSMRFSSGENSIPGPIEKLLECLIAAEAAKKPKK